MTNVAAISQRASLLAERARQTAAAYTAIWLACDTAGTIDAARAELRRNVVIGPATQLLADSG